MDSTGGASEILSLHGISKAYGHVQALWEVDLDLRRGEILGIVGDNGAGKSSLMKVIAGGVRPDSGEMRVDGAGVSIEAPADARRLGIEMIYQDLALFDNLSVAANIFIGRESTSGRAGLMSILRERRMHERAEELLRRLKIGISSTRLPVEGLSGGQRQMVAIARAIAFESRILIMDEPSAALGSVESATVLELIRSLREHGVSVIVISHRIPEVLGLADRVLVMKRGQRVAVVDGATITVEECVNLIVSGRPPTRDPAEPLN
jgi:simple sugar transport system ATP-binding protein